MCEFDLIVIGGGAGNTLATSAARSGMAVALVEERALGGTCLTRGCNPSKSLVHRADVVEGIRAAEAFGIDATVDGIDFDTIVRESTEPFDEQAARIEENLRDAESISLYKEEASFVDDRTVAVGDEEIQADDVVIAAGARPMIPDSIDGLDEVEYVTSDGALRFETCPDHLVVIGGGYVAAEMGHVYGALGAEVSIVGRSDTLLPREDRAVSATFTEHFADRYDVLTGHTATAVSRDGDRIAVRAETEDGEVIEVAGDELLIATGRRPNSDRLGLDRTGVETDEKGFIQVDEYMETTADNVWAIGDIVGNAMFWHSAIREAEYVYRTLVDDGRMAVEYDGMGHAVFSSPQLASMGRTEGDLEDDDVEYRVGRAEYSETSMGMAMKATDGFVKVLASADDDRVLGCHIVGPDASTLIHEVMVATRAGPGTVSAIRDAIHIHPALNEVVQRAFNDV